MQKSYQSTNTFWATKIWNLLCPGKQIKNPREMFLCFPVSPIVTMWSNKFAIIGTLPKIIKKTDYTTKFVSRWAFFCFIIQAIHHLATSGHNSLNKLRKSKKNHYENSARNSFRRNPGINRHMVLIKRFDTFWASFSFINFLIHNNLYTYHFGLHLENKKMWV